MLFRLISYIQSTLHLRLRCYIGDAAKDVFLELFADADFAGDKKSSRSTSGVLLAISGPRSFFPLGAQSKKQGCVSHSTPEAEIVAAAHALRTEGLPALDLWDCILERPVQLRFQEDNQTAILAMQRGFSAEMRHLERTHRVSLAWLAEVFALDQIELNYCVSAKQAADIFTKSFDVIQKWKDAVRLIGIS